MSAPRTAPVRDDVLDRYHALVAVLRDVEHWRRLVAARLDLAVAAVTDIDDLVPALPGGWGAAGGPPDGLRGLIGLPHAEDACTEAAALLRLRAVLGQLDAYAAALRPVVAQAGQDAGLPPVPARPHLVPAPRGPGER